jgi:hypothetical protein
MEMSDGDDSLLMSSSFSFFVLPVWDPLHSTNEVEGRESQKATRKEEEGERYAIPLAIP